MSVLLPLLPLLRTKVLECSRLVAIERRQEASSGSGGRGGWILIGKRRIHVLTLCCVMRLRTPRCGSPPDDTLQEICVAILGRCPERRASKRRPLAKHARRRARGFQPRRGSGNGGGVKLAALLRRETGWHHGFLLCHDPRGGSELDGCRATRVLVGEAEPRSLAAMARLLLLLDERRDAPRCRYTRRQMLFSE